MKEHAIYNKYDQTLTKLNNERTQKERKELPSDLTWRFDKTMVTKSKSRKLVVLKDECIVGRTRFEILRYNDEIVLSVMESNNKQ